MSPVPHARPTVGAGPAPATADVFWLIDSARSSLRPLDRAATVVSRCIVGLGVVAGGVWLYDVARLVGG